MERSGRREKVSESKEKYVKVERTKEGQRVGRDKKRRGKKTRGGSQKGRVRREKTVRDRKGRKGMYRVFGRDNRRHRDRVRNILRCRGWLRWIMLNFENGIW